MASRWPLGLSTTRMTLSVPVVSHHPLSPPSPADLLSDPFSLMIGSGHCRERPTLQRFSKCLWWVMRHNLIRATVTPPSFGTFFYGGCGGGGLAAGQANLGFGHAGSLVPGTVHRLRDKEQGQRTLKLCIWENIPDGHQEAGL